jgi:hypothetical protein
MRAVVKVVSKLFEEYVVKFANKKKNITKNSSDF